MKLLSYLLLTLLFVNIITLSKKIKRTNNKDYEVHVRPYAQNLFQQPIIQKTVTHVVQPVQQVHVVHHQPIQQVHVVHHQPQPVQQVHVVHHHQPEPVQQVHVVHHHQPQPVQQQVHVVHQHQPQPQPMQQQVHVVHQPQPQPMQQQVRMVHQHQPQPQLHHAQTIVQKTPYGVTVQQSHHQHGPQPVQHVIQQFNPNVQFGRLVNIQGHDIPYTADSRECGDFLGMKSTAWAYENECETVMNCTPHICVKKRFNRGCCIYFYFDHGTHS
jgi:hypothetical protein